MHGAYIYIYMKFLYITLVFTGKPRPRVSWWQGDVLLDDVMETPLVIGSASKFTENRLFIGRVTRSLWGTKLECRAESRAQEKSKTVVRKVPLDIYRKLRKRFALFTAMYIYVYLLLIHIYTSHTLAALFMMRRRRVARYIL